MHWIDFAGGRDPVAERWWTSPERRGHPVALACILFAAEDPEGAAGFYEELCGRARASSEPDTIELAWPCGAHVAFERAGGDTTGIVAFEFEEAAVEPRRIGQTAVTFGPSRP